MYEWLEGLQKSAKRTAAGVAPEDVQRAETESGNPFPEELGVLFKRFNGGDFQGDVTLFALHGSGGEPSVMEKTRLKLEGLPAAGVWRIGVKGPHRQLFAARKSAMREQSDEPLPGWAEALSDDDWLYGTWETEARELKLYRSFASMIEVLVPPAEVEEFGERTFARALVAVHGRLNDISEEYDQGEQSEDEELEDEESESDEALEGEKSESDEEEAPRTEERAAQEAESDEEEEAEGEEEEAEGEEEEAEEEEAEEEEAEGEEEAVESEDEAVESEDEEAEGEEEEAESEDEEAESEDEEETEGEEDEELRKPVVAAAQRRVGGLRKSPAREPVTPEETPQRVAKKGAGSRTPARKQSERPAPASRGSSPAKKAAAQKTPAKKASAQKAPARKAAAKKPAAKTSAARKAPAKKAAAQKAPAKKAAAKKSTGRTPAARKAPAKKSATKKSAAKKPTTQRGGSRGRR